MKAFSILVLCKFKEDRDKQDMLRAVCNELQKLDLGDLKNHKSLKVSIIENEEA